jgi:MFS family permease
LGAPILVIGVFFTAKSLSNFILMSPGGMMADKYGRRKVILVGHCFRLGTIILYLLPTTWQQLLPALILEAFSHMWGPAIYSTILESLPEKRRTSGFAVVQTILLLVNSVTMLMGGVFIDSLGIIAGVKTMLVIGLVLEATRFGLRFLFLRETLEKKDRAAYTPGKSMLRQNLQLGRSVWVMLVTRCLYQMGFQMSSPFIVVYFTGKIGFTKTEWGFIQMCFLLAFAIFSVPGGLLAEKFGNRLAIILSGIIAPLPLISYIFLQDFNLLLLVNIISGIGAGLGGVSYAGPAWQTMTADLVPPERRGAVMGLMGTISGLAGAITPTLGGFMWEASPTVNLFSSAMFETGSLFTFYAFAGEASSKSTKKRLKI